MPMADPPRPQRRVLPPPVRFDTRAPTPRREPSLDALELEHELTAPPKETTMPTDKSDEIIALLKQAEGKRVTHSDLQRVADTMAQGHQSLERKVDGIGLRLDGLHGIVGSQGVALTALDKRVGKIEAAPSRRPSPMPVRYDVEQTAGGGIKIKQEDFDAIQQKLDDQDREKAIAEAKQDGAARAIADLESKAERVRKKITFALALLIPAAGILGWLATHIFHL